METVLFKMDSPLFFFFVMPLCTRKVRWGSSENSKQSDQNQEHQY